MSAITFFITKAARLAGTLVLLLLVLAASASDYIPKEIDVNRADTTVFMALPGIGSTLAARIVSYREKLHGFCNISQVGETFGLADSTFQKIKKWLVLRDTTLNKININTASAEELRTPYISYNLANAIFRFRLQHGAYKSVEDIKRIMLVSREVFERIAPYLTVGS